MPLPVGSLSMVPERWIACSPIISGCTGPHMTSFWLLMLMNCSLCFHLLTRLKYCMLGRTVAPDAYQFNPRELTSTGMSHVVKFVELPL